jgi:ATP-dependent exoDNAse (exonuclease V) alpha subunit
MLLRRGIGRVSVEAAKAFAKDDPRFIRNGEQVTTREALAEETSMIATARKGQGKFSPIEERLSDVKQSSKTDYLMSVEQSAAVAAILGSRDLVTTLHGPAGSGKTTLMREAIQAIETLSGKTVLTLAPSSSAVSVLKTEGFSRSQTFQSFQGNQLLQSVARGQVLWIDEAGFLSARQMRWLVDFAARERCRLILSGDTKQHHSVERGDALRVLEESGAVTTAMLNRIIRQKIEPLRAAVQDLSQGRTAEGFDKLNAFGAVHESSDKDERLSAIAELHLDARSQGRSSLIVAPTHAECRAIADAVRERQKENGSIGAEDHTVTRLAKVNLTESQRSDPINYSAGQVVEFHRKAKGGFKSGQQWKVATSKTGAVVVVKDGQSKVLPLNQANTFDL